MKIPEVLAPEGPLTWEEFERELVTFKSKAGIEECSSGEKKPNNVSELVFRGHSDKKWGLKSSLDRHLEDLGNSPEDYSLENYYKVLGAIAPAINSLSSYEFADIRENNLDYAPWKSLENYRELCLIRHLGFPSPLLDWTYSPYVAAFFAFRDARPHENVAIFAFQEWTGSGQTGSGADTRINQLGPYVQSHHRHYRQRATYTLCTKKERDDHFLGIYENAFSENPKNHRIRKFVIRSSEKERVLLRLFSMNINDYTLFGDDEALMRMLAYKEFRRIR